MNEVRVSSGIPALDEILHGGFISNHTYLLVGGAGTGKTILSLQWLLDGVRRGESCLFITLVEPHEEMERNMAAFGWTLAGIDVLDLAPTEEPDEVGWGEYHIFPPGEVERTPIWQRIYTTLEEKKPRRVVIDSTTQLRYLSTDEYQFRKHILGLVSYLHRLGCTAIFTYDPSEMERETSLALAVDGVIRLRRETSPDRVIDLRSVQVEKLRGSDYLSGLHPLRITSEGIVIFPHRVEQPNGEVPGTRLLASGIPGLDELLHGGVASGTTTMISGPTGVGKTTLGVQFMLQAARSGHPAILFVFEESPISVLTRCRALNMPVDKYVRNGKIRLVRVNPLQLYPDEFLSLVREVVEGEGFRVVMVDSLRGYNLAMEQYGSLEMHLYNLVTYLNSQGANTILINEVEHITGDLRFTELGISYVVDDAIFLRYAEVRSRVIRIIGCLKKRLGDFQPELRPFLITSEGLHVGDSLPRLRGLLTGVPEQLE